MVNQIIMATKKIVDDKCIYLYTDFKSDMIYPVKINIFKSVHAIDLTHTLNQLASPLNKKD